MWFADTLRPPGKQRGRTDEIRAGLQDGTALELDGLQLLEIAEMAVDQRRIRERPEVLGRLKLGRVGGQEQQVDILGHRQAVAGVPARAVEHEHDVLVRSGPGGLGKSLQFHREVGGGDAGGQVPDGAARGGMDESHQVAPLVARLDGGDGTFAWERPDASQEGLEADAVLVGGPKFDARIGEGGGDVADERTEPF